MVPLGSDPNDSSAQVSSETYRRLQCYIDNETNFLFQGIRLSLTEQRELRGQHFQRTSTLLTLPPYLIVQMMRFDWRKDTQKKSKKLRKVDYPMKFDVAEFAHPTLKHQLLSARMLLKEEQDQKLGLNSLSKKAKTEAGQTAGSAPSPSPSPDAANPWAASSPTAMDVDAGSASSGLTLTTPTSGYFELYGIVTHKGRTSDSGHYVAWTKQSDGRWMNFDDDVVTVVDEEKVKGLAGGGDWHVAYLLFYRRIDDATKFIGQAIPDQPAHKQSEEKKSSPPPAAASASAPPAASSN